MPSSLQRLTRSGALLVALAGLNPGPAGAATVSGWVRDGASAEPLPAAVVAFPDLRLGGATNGRGYFAVRHVPPGRHRIVVDLIGYAAWADSLTIATADTTLEVALRAEAIGLAETVVAAERATGGGRERALQPGYVSLPAQRLQRLPAVGEADLLRSLQLLPGIQSASDISSGLYVRGGSPDQTLILLDGVPLYNPSHAFGFFSTFQPDAVGDVQLYKSAYPATYGGQLGGVLDVSQRQGGRDSLGVHGGVSLIAARLLAEGPAGDGTWMVAARRTYLDPVLAAVRAAGADVPSYYFYDLNARWSQPLTPRDRLTLSAYYGRDDLDFDLDTESFFGVRWGNRAASARWTRLFTPALFGEFTLSGSAYDSGTAASFFDTPVRVDNRIDDLTARFDAEFFASRDHTLAAGLRATRYQVRFAESFNRQDGLILDLSPRLWEVYLQDEARLPTGTRVRAGVRGAWFSAGSRQAWMPRLAVSQPLPGRLRWNAAVGTYRQYMQWVTTEGFSGGDFWVPLDGTVEAGSSRQATTGLEWEPSPRYRLSAEVYASDLGGLVVLDNNTAVDDRTATSDALFVAGGTGRAVGLELFVEKRRGRLTGWVGYTLGRARRTFAEIDDGRSFAPKVDRRHDLSVVATWRRGPWRFGSSFVYATGQAFTPAAARYTLRDPATGVPQDRVLAAARNSARLLPYHRLDVSARRSLSPFGFRAEAYLQVFNLYSRRNEWFVQYDTADPETKPEVVRQLPVVPTLGLEFSF